jgi:hypothetical protein
MSNKGRLISWLDRHDLPVRAQHAGGKVAEVLFHHKTFGVDGDRIHHVIHVRVNDLLPVTLFYEDEVNPGESCLLPVRCDGYRDILCGVGVEYVSAVK